MNPQSESATKPQMIKYKKKKESIYCKVENVKRIALLKMVKEEGKTLKEASNILGINYSTAKTILRVYRIEKRILKKTSMIQSHSNEGQNVKIFSICYFQLRQLYSITQSCVNQIAINEMVLIHLRNKMNILCEQVKRLV